MVEWWRRRRTASRLAGDLDHDGHPDRDPSTSSGHRILGMAVPPHAPAPADDAERRADH
jgi:membrane-associated protein